MKKKTLLIKLNRKKTLNNNSVYLYIFESLKKLNFKVRRIYFHDYKKNHLIKNKVNNNDTIFIPLKGTLFFTIGNKKIILKKNHSLFIKQNVTFDLKSSNSYFVVLANKNYR